MVLLLLAGIAAVAVPAFASERAGEGPLVCERESTTGEIERLLLDAELAYARLDLEGFRGAAELATRALPCVAEAILPTTAARYHRVRGMVHFVARERHAAARAFAAARWIEPAWRFPDTLVPANNPLLADYSFIVIEGARFQAILRPDSGRVTIDGLPVLLRSLEWPSIVQLFDSTGAVICTSYLTPQQELPSYRGKKERRKPPRKDR